MIVITSETERDNSVFYADLEENGPITGKIPLIPLITKMDADYGVNNEFKFHFHFSWNNFKFYFLPFTVCDQYRYKVSVSYQ